MHDTFRFDLLPLQSWEERISKKLWKQLEINCKGVITTRARLIHKIRDEETTPETIRETILQGPLKWVIHQSRAGGPGIDKIHWPKWPLGFHTLRIVTTAWLSSKVMKIMGSNTKNYIVPVASLEKSEKAQRISMVYFDGVRMINIFTATNKSNGHSISCLGGEKW